MPRSIDTKNVTRVEIAYPGGVAYLWDAYCVPPALRAGTARLAMEDRGDGTYVIKVFIDSEDTRSRANDKG
jgi:predicted nucleic acid-binding protein